MGVWDCVGNSLPVGVLRVVGGREEFGGGKETLQREWAVGCLVWAGRVLCEVAGVIVLRL